MKKMCGKHGEYEVEYMDWFQGRKLELPCPLCAKERDDEIAMEEFLQSWQSAKEIQSRMFTSRNIKPRYRWMTFDDVLTTTEHHSNVVATVKDYFDNQDDVLKSGRSMVFYGGVGTGKTMLANILVQNWTGSAKYINARAYTRQIRETYGDNNLTEQSVLNAYVGYDLLVIDEVGKQFSTDAERFSLFDLINGRYNNMKPTILITNMNLSDLTSFVGADTIDRVKENGGSALKFDWGSMRGKK